MSQSSPYCLISYSRKDAAMAQWLQRSLESYKYPADIVKPERRPADRAYVRPVFLDTSDLSTSEGVFWNDIRSKIEQSRYLLVLCSRASASSAYVDKEIATFIGQDESRLDRVILAILDPEIRLSSPSEDHFPPQILQRWERLSSRNHPQLRPTAGESDSDTRKRGLMQIVSFMLGVDWILLHNRHLIAQRKAARRAAVIGISVLAAIMLSLAWALWKQRELTTFERKVFPRSVVFGYVGNFLSPLITALEKPGETPLVIIALPDAFGNLDHEKRVESYNRLAAQNNFTAVRTEKKTKLPRGAVTYKISPEPAYYKDRNISVYIDFASTVTTFNDVILYKKKNPAYARTTEDQMLKQYADEFEQAVLDELRKTNQSDRVVFVRSPEAALRILQRE
jgi:hypothetical protein